jgi:hypothetical protein
VTRLALGAFALLVIAQIAVYSPRALPSMILAAAAVIALLVFEEGRVRSARSAEDTAAKRVCHHGGSSWGPFDPNGDERERGSW